MQSQGLWSQQEGQLGTCMTEGRCTGVTRPDANQLLHKTLRSCSWNSPCPFSSLFWLHICFYLKCLFISVYPANFYTSFKMQLNSCLWGPLVTSLSRIKHIILWALRAGTVFCCRALHILFSACIIVCTSLSYGICHIATVILIAIITCNCWELYLRARLCAKCLRWATSLNPHSFPLGCPHLTNEETDPSSNPQLPGSVV